MGSYLEINERETNCKAFSHILIGAIRQLDTMVREDENLSKAYPNAFKAEYYNDNGVGCGDYVIKKKGIAMLASLLKTMSGSENYLRDLAYEQNEYYLKNIAKEEETPEKMKEFMERAKYDVDWCYRYVADILCEMELNNQRQTRACWV